jgi:hypothetical protein
MYAEILVTGIASVLSQFLVPIKYYAFAGREAFWSLSGDTNSNPMLDIYRMIDALRSGGRPGSYPLDAILTAENDWTERRNAYGGIPAGEYHLTFMISDFLST